MTSLHVICGLGPPIKNPGYAYGEHPPLQRPGVLTIVTSVSKERVPLRSTGLVQQPGVDLLIHISNCTSTCGYVGADAISECLGKTPQPNFISKANVKNQLDDLELQIDQLN